MNYINVASSSQDITLACVWIEDSAPPPPVQPSYGAPGVGGPYPPQPNYGPPPPYSGGPGYAPPMYPNQPYQQQAAPPGQYYVSHSTEEGCKLTNSNCFFLLSR